MAKNLEYFRKGVPTPELPGWMTQTLRFAARKRRVLCGVFVGTVLLALAAALLSRPVYEVGATIAFKPDPVSGREDKTNGRARPEQLARPQMVMLESEGVIRKAIDAVGAERLYPRLSERAPSTGQYVQIDTTAGERVRRLITPLAIRDQAFIAASSAITVRAEPNTELIRAYFRHSDPELAVEFANAWLQAFTDRYYQLYSNADALQVLWEQQKRSNDIYQRASAALAKFSAESQIFQVGDQRRLLLERRNNLASSVATTNGSIADKQSQADAIPHQLAQMKPINRVSQVLALTRDQVGDAAANGRARPTVPNVPQDPPLLLIKVYQDTIANLVRLQTELAGQRSLVTQQRQSLGAIDAELNALSVREAEFERRQQEVNQARRNAEEYMRRAKEEEFFQEMNARKLSSVQVLQAPTMPFNPIWPRPLAFTLLAMFWCALAILATYLLGAYQATLAQRSDMWRDNTDGTAPVPAPVVLAAE